MIIFILHFDTPLLHSIFIHYFHTPFWYFIDTPPIVGNAFDTTRPISEKNNSAEKGSSRRTSVTGISKRGSRCRFLDWVPNVLCGWPTLSYMPCTLCADNNYPRTFICHQTKPANAPDTRKSTKKAAAAEISSPVNLNSAIVLVPLICFLMFCAVDLHSPTCHVHYVRIIITLAPSFVTRPNLRNRLTQGKAHAWPPTPSKRPREKSWPTLPRKGESGVASPEHRRTRARLQTLTQ